MFTSTVHESSTQDTPPRHPEQTHTPSTHFFLPSTSDHALSLTPQEPQMRRRLGAAPTAPRAGMASSLYRQSHAQRQPLRLSLPEARPTRMARQYRKGGWKAHQGCSEQPPGRALPCPAQNEAIIRPRNQRVTVEGHGPEGAGVLTMSLEQLSYCSLGAKRDADLESQTFQVGEVASCPSVSFRLPAGPASG